MRDPRGDVPRAGCGEEPAQPAAAGLLYREHAPHPALARHVECYWSIRAEIDRSAPASDRVLPDGCVDIIVSIGGAVSGTPARAPFAVGTMTRPLAVTYSGSVDLFSVRFRPGAARPFLAVDASELTDGTLPLEELWGGKACTLQERLASCRDARDRAAVLDAFLHARLERGPDPDVRVLAALDLLVQRHGVATLEEMAAAAELGARQLERRFLAAVGVPPRTARRVARFRRAVAIMGRRPGTTLSEVAFAAGYADQPHLTRDFRALAGVTPAVHLRARDAAAQAG